VFLLDEDGTTFVIEAGPEYKLLGRNSVKEMFWSTPNVAGDSVLLRSVDHLYCITK